MSPPRMLVPEPLLRFQCTLNGCCCGTWALPLAEEDVELLQQHFGVEEAANYIETTPDPFEVLALRQIDKDGRRICSLLCDNTQCDLHTRFGVGSLPQVCALFPASCFRVGDHYELRFQTFCPGVLLKVMEPGPPLQVVGLPKEGVPGSGPLDRARQEDAARRVHCVRIGRRRLKVEPAVQLRARMLDLCQTWTGDSLSLAAALSGGLSQVRDGLPPKAYRLVPLRPGELEPFARELAEEFPEDLLAEELKAYRPFLGPHLPDDLPPQHRLLEALRGWQEALRVRWEPVADELDPLLKRFVWLRVYGSFSREFSRFEFNGRRELRVVALTLRVAAALAEATDQPLVRAQELRAAAGFASYLDYTVDFQSLDLRTALNRQ